MAVALGVAYAAAQFAGQNAFLDNLSNFPVHFAAGFLASAAVLTALKSRAWALACAAAAALAIAPVVPWYFGPAAGPTDAARPQVKLLVSNVRLTNQQRDRLKRLVAQESPDVVGLIEVNSAWLRELQSLRSGYAHHFEVPSEGFAGFALYSRLPIEGARIMQVAGSTPAIAAKLKTASGEIEIILAHPTSPLNAEFIRLRNEQLLALAQYVGAAQGPVVLAGDLNLTMWNRGYRPLADVGGLQNARDGHGVGPTWPYTGWLGVPIDHVLATPDVALRNFRVLDAIGSDHLPISAEFSLR